jgi:hypothetical protein
MHKIVCGLLFAIATTFSSALSKKFLERPTYVVDRLAHKKTMYYFGIGSNMLRSKLENRGLNASKIDLIDMEPGYVPNYRLAFNMRGFAPLEPGMGSLEPINGSRPLLAYEKPECHGALVTLTAENYEKVMASEGVSFNQTNPGYEEIVVTVIPYDTRKAPVEAIALRARPHVRLRKDPCPSERYMSILREGAKELGLLPSYQEYLNQHPTQFVPVWLRKIAIHNFIATFMISTLLKWRGLSRAQSLLLFAVYVPSNAPRIVTSLSHLASSFILLPGAIFGALIQFYFTAFNKQPPPFVNRFITLLNTTSTENQPVKR